MKTLSEAINDKTLDPIGYIPVGEDCENPIKLFTAQLSVEVGLGKKTSLTQRPDAVGKIVGAGQVI